MRDNLTIRLSAEEREILQGIASQNGCTVSQAVRLLIRMAASDQGKDDPDEQTKRKLNKTLWLVEENNLLLRKLCEQEGADQDSARNQVKQNTAERFKARNGVKSKPAEKHLNEPQDLTQQMSITDFPEIVPEDVLFPDSYEVTSIDDLSERMK